MRYFKSTLDYALIFLNILLLILLVFYDKVTLPYWFGTLGKLHPLVLHLPIGLWVGVVLLFIIRKTLVEHKELLFVFLQLTAFFSAIAAVAGIILSIAGGYDAEQINLHKYTGAALSWLMWIGTLLYHKIPTNGHKIMYGSLSVLLLLTGHWGGEITHGEDFLSFRGPEKEIQLLETDTVYTSLVKPILKSKCESCHGNSKTKGDLNLSTVALMLKGGEDGPAFVEKNALESHMLKLILLPLDDKKHMPPKGKSQLSDAEIEILTAWIEEGVMDKMQFAQLKTNSPLRNYLNIAKAETYDFSALSTKDIEDLNTPFFDLVPLAIGSPALDASSFVKSKFEPAQLEKLLKAKKQIVSLNLNKMPVKDEQLKMLSQLENLRDLSLNGTEVNGSFLAYIKDLKHLKRLSLANTKLSGVKFPVISSLEKLYVWESGLSEQEVANIQKANPTLKIDRGYSASNEAPIAINPPETNEKKVFVSRGNAVILKHVLPNVMIKYTLDGTEPDSSHGEKYLNPIVVDKNISIKARAFKESWLGSKSVSFVYLVDGISPDSAYLKYPPNAKYAARGANSLYDKQKGDPGNILDKSWLGYREQDFESVFMFNTPKDLESITISMLENIGSYIMPPKSIEVWSKEGKLLAKSTPVQPTVSIPVKNTFYSVNFDKAKFTEIRIVVKRVNPLPAWHPGKGTSAWVFIDEIIFN